MYRFYLIERHDFTYHRKYYFTVSTENNLNLIINESIVFRYHMINIIVGLDRKFFIVVDDMNSSNIATIGEALNDQKIVPIICL